MAASATATLTRTARSRDQRSATTDCAINAGLEPTRTTNEHTRRTADLVAIRQILEEQRTFRHEQLAELAATEGAAQATGTPVEALDASADNARAQVSLVIAAAAIRALADIDAAIERMDAGRYGNCEHCGQAIPAERLEAIPQAAYCMRCQHRAEVRR